MKLTIEITMENAAFADDPGEVARIVGETAETLAGTAGLGVGDGLPLRDSNGNTVGRWTVTE